MNKIQVELVGDAINGPVIKLDGRRFPGILLQGDSLANLCAVAQNVIAALSDGRIQSACEEATELSDQLSSYKRAYESAMTSDGLELPYPPNR